MGAEFVRVRIAVAANRDGNFEAAGGDEMSDDERRGYATMWMEERNLEVHAVHFAEVSVPLPQTVEGEVESEPEGGR